MFVCFCVCVSVWWWLLTRTCSVRSPQSDVTATQSESTVFKSCVEMLGICMKNNPQVANLFGAFSGAPARMATDFLSAALLLFMLPALQLVGGW